MADAAATAIGNIIRTADDIQKGVDMAADIDGLSGVIIIIGDKLGVYGDIDLCRIDK